ncbi:MAG: putative CRISPR-associated protein, partial [Cyanobacteria bacterium P01_H01_bin.121]
MLGNLARSEGDLKAAFAAEDWQQITQLLLQQENSNRICGAEINSITSILQQQLLSQTLRLIFLISDTSAGQKIGKILKLYYEDMHNPFHFKNVEVRVLNGLRDDDVRAFKQQGLKNLVHEISKECRNFSAEAIAINATGGYKAQISFAGMVGQALGIPVYYLFELFS